MSDNNIKKLQELVKIARDGADFYGTAAEKIKSTLLRATFRRQAQAKLELVAALSNRLGQLGGDVPESGTTLGALHMVYAEIKATLSSKDEKIYVAELEAVEDRLLGHFTAAISECADPELVTQLQAHLPTVRARHDEMRSLKKQMAA